MLYFYKKNFYFNYFRKSKYLNVDNLTLVTSSGKTAKQYCRKLYCTN